MTPFFFHFANFLTMVYLLFFIVITPRNLADA